MVPQSSDDTLDARDLELLSHYLTHTSRIIPLDEVDAYALQVGFPNLAFGSKPLMSSILALAAVCQCHDLVAHEQQAADPDISLAHIRELLTLAEHHHTVSLRLIQEAIEAPTVERYDCVLAGAALMTLYGSASHCLRINLVETHKSKGGAEPLPIDLVPVQVQWVSLIRAAHFAYIGVVTSQTKDPPGTVQNLWGCDGGTPRGLAGTDSGVGIMTRPEDGPTDDTRRLFLPIVAATSASAMETLRTRARRVTEAAGSNPDLQACWEALAMLETTMRQVFTDQDATLARDAPETAEPWLPQVVAPWLRTYIARVTCNNRDSSRPLRRTVSSFLNRVPAAYVSLVQAMVDRMPSDGAGSGGDEGSIAEVVDGGAHLLAVDIFAHWLVLEMLLDGVWWIGETGAWELGRVVASMQCIGGHKGTIGAEHAIVWWPENMYKIRMRLRKHTT